MSMNHTENRAPISSSCFQNVDIYKHSGQQTVDSCLNGQNQNNNHLCVFFSSSPPLRSIEAGNCFNHRINDMCYDLSEADVNEDECSGPYYSNDLLKELDGYVYAEKCNDVHRKCKQ